MPIRPAVPADIPAMHRVRLAVRENRLTRSVITAADYEDALTRTGRGWVAEVDGVLRGFAVAKRTDGSIWALFVEPGFEGRGLGRALHDAMLDWLRSTPCETAWLVTEAGTRAAAFYQKAGWRLVQVVDGEAKFERALRESA